MAVFTMYLRDVLEDVGATTTIVNGQTVFTNVGEGIGLEHYPIFEEEYREILNGLIVDRYYMREIGFESISLFRLGLRRKMNEIMPYFNKLYNSEKIIYDPLSTIKIRTVALGTATQSAETVADGTSTSEADSESRSVTSETPQTMLSGSGDYATAAADSKGKSVNDATSNQTTNENQESVNETDSETSGYQGVSSDLIMRYRDSLLNINLSVLDELNDLFMNIWDNGDSYTNSRGLIW